MKIIINNYSDWNIWDLHLHSPFSYDYKGIDKVTNIDNWIDKLIFNAKKNNIKLISVTDHHMFSEELYEKIDEKIQIEKTKDNNFYLEIIPGIEINVLPEKTWLDKGAKKEWQILIYFNPNSYKLINEATNKIKEKGNEFNYILSIFSELDCFIVGEGSKTNGLFSLSKNNDLEKITEKTIKRFGAIGSLRGFNDSESGHFWTREKLRKIVDDNFKNGLELVNFSASDNHNIDSYPKYDKGNYKPWTFNWFKALPTFTGLKFALSERDRISQEKINQTNQSSQISKIKINDTNINFSSGINVVIGSRSTGKSLLMHLLDSHINKTKIKDDYENETKKMKVALYDYSELIFDKKGANKFIDQSDLISKAYDKNFDLTKGLNKEISEINLFKENENIIFLLNTLKEIMSLINDIAFSSVSPLESLEILEASLDNLEEFNTNLLTTIKIFITNNKLEIIDSIKNTVSTNILEINKLSNQVKKQILKIKEVETSEILKEFTSIKDLHYTNQIQNINNEIEFMKKITVEHQNLLNELSINKFKNIVNFFLNEEKKHLENSSIKNILKQNKIQELKNTNEYYSLLAQKINSLKYLKFIFKNTIMENGDSKLTGEFKIKTYTKHTLKDKYLDQIFYSDFVKNFKFNEDEEKTLNYEETLKNIINYKFEKPNEKIWKKPQETIEHQLKSIYNTTIVTDIEKDGESIEHNSPGKKAQILFELQMWEIKESNKNRILIIDQPEDSIDNKYVSNEMKKILKSLSKTIQIFMVTHNPNLVVNLDPENIIIPNKKREIITYVNGSLESKVKWNNKEITMTKLISEEIEGGHKAIIKRIDKYESGGLTKDGN